MLYPFLHHRHYNSTISLRSILAFASGTVFGFSLVYLWIGAFRLRELRTFSPVELSTFYLNTLDGANFPQFKKNVENSIGRLSPIVYTVDRRVAEDLSRRVRVLCWIVTSPSNEKGAKIVKATWGKRCNVLMFTSTKEDEDLPTVTLNMTEDPAHMVWGKTKKGFAYIYEHYLDSVDWFMKADDHNYVVMENLRYMLQPHNSNDPMYFGRQFLAHSKQGYMSGGAGYVLSREALKRFVEAGLPDSTKCRADDGGQEDLEMGRCLENVGVVAGDSRDSFGRGRFFPFDPATHIVPGLMADIQWYWQYTNISYSEGIDCCSDTTISFHYVFPELMYNYDYLIYHLHSRTIN